MTGYERETKRFSLGRVKVDLTCGHHVWMKLQPLREGAKFACRSGMGCGYMLGWLAYEDTESGRVGQNYQLQEKIRLAEAKAEVESATETKGGDAG